MNRILINKLILVKNKLKLFKKIKKKLKFKIMLQNCKVKKIKINDFREILKM